MKAFKVAYPFKLTKEGNKFLVQFVDLPEAFTEGDTLEQALFNAHDVLSLVLTQRMEDGAEIPVPSSVAASLAKGAKAMLVPDASVQAALLTRLVRTHSGKKMAELARAMDTSWPSAQRLEDPRHATSLKQLERAAAAMGHKLVLSFEPTTQH